MYEFNIRFGDFIEQRIWMSFYQKMFQRSLIVVNKDSS